MRYAKKSPEELWVLRRSLVYRLVQERPSIPVAARWIWEALGLNQADFAALVGLSKPQIARLERGEANPTLDTLLAVGKPFGLTMGFCHPDPMAQQVPAGSLSSASNSMAHPLLGKPPRSGSPVRSATLSHKVPKLSFDKKRPKE